MPKKDEILRIWAPSECPWSPWVKPVLFSFMDGVFDVRSVGSIVFDREWVPKPGSTAIVIDLPGEEGVMWGLKLAGLGYRPVPLYNALPFAIGDKMISPSSRPATTVHVEAILAALVREAVNLEKLRLLPSAPPAFLLDADRRLARTEIRPGIFDNRSVCFTTDFPSASFLLEHGIRSVTVVQEGTKFAPDLLPTLVAWQHGGIEIQRKRYRNPQPLEPVVVKKASFLNWLWFRLTVALGFYKGELGALGEIVPASSG